MPTCLYTLKPKPKPERKYVETNEIHQTFNKRMIKNDIKTKFLNLVMNIKALYNHD